MTSPRLSSLAGRLARLGHRRRARRATARRPGLAWLAAVSPTRRAGRGPCCRTRPTGRPTGPVRRRLRRRAAAGVARSPTRPTRTRRCSRWSGCSEAHEQHRQPPARRDLGRRPGRLHASCAATAVSATASSPCSARRWPSATTSSATPALDRAARARTPSCPEELRARPAVRGRRRPRRPPCRSPTLSRAEATTPCAWPTGGACWRSPARDLAAAEPAVHRRPGQPRARRPRRGGPGGRRSRRPRRAAGRPRRRLPAHRDRHGQVRRPGAQLRQRRRRDLRRRAGASGDATRRPRSRPAPGSRPALARVCSAAPPRARSGRSTPRCGPEGKDGPLVRTLASHRAVLRALGQDLGVPGAAQGPAGRRRPRARRGSTSRRSARWSGRRPSATTSSRTCRRCAAGSRRTCPAGTASGSSSSAPAGCATSSSACSCCSWSTAGPTSDCARRTPWTASSRCRPTATSDGTTPRALDRAYRILRVLEHRLQLPRLRRTHVVPEAPDDLRRLGRAFGLRADPADGARPQLWKRHALEVRPLHERLFYRPVLAAAARLTADEARLTPEAADARLAALGYRDPAGAHAAPRARSPTASAAARRSSGSCSPCCSAGSPTAPTRTPGCSAFRRVSDALGADALVPARCCATPAPRPSGWRACSRPAGYARTCCAAARGRPAGWGRRGAGAARSARVADGRGRCTAAARTTTRRPRRSRSARSADASCCGRRSPTSSALADLDEVGQRAQRRDGGRARGRAHGREPTRSRRTGRASAADAARRDRRWAGSVGASSATAATPTCCSCTTRCDGTDEGEAQARPRTRSFAELRRLMVVRAPSPPLTVDVDDLRPEGRDGPLVRSLESYAEYYAGGRRVGGAGAAAGRAGGRRRRAGGAVRRRSIDPLRYPAARLDRAAVRELRRIKARVESERLPRGVDPQPPPQARAAAVWPTSSGPCSCCSCSTRASCRAADDVHSRRAAAAAEARPRAGADAETLEHAWRLTSKLRNALVLWRGRATDVMPTDRRDLDGVARLLGYPPASGGPPRGGVLRTMRRARSVVERVFYG